ncbi:hypothetical protein N7492_007802 [Penicillium capsulatum]|uniref:Serum paraoxonase/arylesterase family protein n=1 Tax=Penicillium capsulatum TaxID=69766 RepID=A0A9W9LLM7_9EURO|nr:hypothetical protein N7492_007802 [Penicillium capsulatum]KAJ6117632.1 hypothetical protein N7512_007357 [Penicillium capsulatum]
MGTLRSVVSLSLLAALAAVVIPSGMRWVTIFGPFLTPKPTVLSEGQGPVLIADTVHCEDVHHYRPANLIFTACEDTKATRFDWFPGLGHLTPPAVARGSLHIIDPKTMISKRLKFENFPGSFVTHGIDVIQDPEQADAVYIFAVNHLPNPEYLETSEPAKGVPPARSQIELFRHVLQSDTAHHVRSILHPLVYTPNDIYAISPHSFYVTNDHFYRDGIMRFVESALPIGKWSTTMHVQILDLEASDATAGIEASVALSGLWSNNGLGHGRTDQELIVTSPPHAELYVSHWHANHTITIQETISFDTVADNPSYYADPYRTDSDDASGFVMAGITQAFYLPQTAKDVNGTEPSQVWYARPRKGSGSWEKKLLFEDDGSRIRSASAAVLVPIPPTDGKKRAWLFVTGFLSESMIAVQVEL